MEISGLGVSKGRVKGIVKIITDKESIETFTEGNILIAKNVSPGMVIAISNARAIITEFGGMNSHPAILSRELGIPAVVGVKDVLNILKDGDEVEVDGDAGIIIRRS